MSLALYKYIYKTQIYEAPTKKNSYRVCISNFNMDTCNTHNDRYNTIKRVVQHDWVSNDTKLKIYEDLHKCNKIYMAFQKLYTHIWCKKLNRFDYTCDICGNSLETLPESCKINIISSNTQYQFRISDLLRIINDSLTNNNYFHLDPCDIKNPYTNETLSIANLYNIYFTVKYSHYKMPQLFHYFFLCNFDKDDFCDQYNYEIREEIIRQKINNLTHPELVTRITRMLKHTQSLFKCIFLSPKLSNNLLISAFKPFLKIYIILSNTQNMAQENILKELFIKKAIAFNDENKLFGRYVSKRCVDIRTSAFTHKSTRKIITHFIPFEKLDISNISRANVRRYSFLNFYDVESSDISDEDEDDDEIDNDETSLNTIRLSQISIQENDNNISTPIAEDRYAEYLSNIRSDHSTLVDMMNSYSGQRNHDRQEIEGTIDDLITNIEND